jgi:hypothetical protein
MTKSSHSLVLSLFIFVTINSFTFDLSQNDKHGNILSSAPCNKDTVIDFSFSPDTIIYSCTTSGCTLVNL